MELHALENGRNNRTLCYQVFIHFAISVGNLLDNDLFHYPSTTVLPFHNFCIKVGRTGRCCKNRHYFQIIICLISEAFSHFWRYEWCHRGDASGTTNVKVCVNLPMLLEYLIYSSQHHLNVLHCRVFQKSKFTGQLQCR